jgi:hypothetical protein
MKKYEKIYITKFFSFIAHVVDTADKHSFPIIFANYWKKLKRSKWDNQGPEGNWLMKKTRSWKSRARLPIIVWSCTKMYGNSASCITPTVYFTCCSSRDLFLVRIAYHRKFPVKLQDSGLDKYYSAPEAGIAPRFCDSVQYIGHIILYV